MLFLSSKINYYLFAFRKDTTKLLNGPIMVLQTVLLWLSERQASRDKVNGLKMLMQGGFYFFQTPINVDILTLSHKSQICLNSIYNGESFPEGFQLTLSRFMRAITLYSSYSLLKCIYFLNNKT